jgi:hypothetical protein
MKEQVDKNRSTIDSYMNADFLLINTSIKHSKYVVNKTIDHFDDASYLELIDRIRVSGFFPTKLYLSFHKTSHRYLPSPILFMKNKVEHILLISF